MSDDARSIEVNKAIVCRINEEGFNQGDTLVYPELYAPDFRLHNKTIPDADRKFKGTLNLLSAVRWTTRRVLALPTTSTPLFCADRASGDSVWGRDSTDIADLA